MTNLTHLKFSMPGFSQKSYDRIHGFDFKKILENIDLLIESFRDSGFKGTPTIAYHLYQFNIGEIISALEFCSNRNILFSPAFAYINDFNMAMLYLNGNINNELLKKVSQDLLLFYVDDLIKGKPEKYNCPQWTEHLVIDEKCNVLTCCAVPKNNKDYSLGSVFEISADYINSQKSRRGVCEECIKSGLAYWGYNRPAADFIENIKYSMLLKKINLPVGLKSLIKYLFRIK